jgi:MOSC domain-containing protein YiiM
MPTIVSIQVGQPTTFVHEGHADGEDRTWTTAFFKTPLAGSVHVGRLGVAGDRQADPENHGGVDKAVLAYSADHYAYWRTHLALPDLPFGGFGENLSIAGLDESGVAIGDIWQAGSAVFEVSQPRQPCWKMSRRWRIADLAAQVIANGKSGWYLRVQEEGEIAAGCEIWRVERPHPHWTVARASRLMHHQKHDLAAAADLAALPELSAAWKDSLTSRIAKRSTQATTSEENHESHESEAENEGSEGI